MALKRRFTDHEKYGLSSEEVKVGEKYLRKHKTAGRIPEPASLQLFEMFLIGHSFQEIKQQFPQYEMGKIILTAALAGWVHDREKMQHTLRDRVQAKVVKSVIEQVDFLTALLSVNNAKHIKTMRDFIADPINNKPPQMQIETIKEYKEVIETLYKIIAGSTPGSKSKTSPLFNALAPNGQSEDDKPEPKELTAAQLIKSEIKE